MQNELIRITNTINNEILEQAVSVLKNGGVIIYPTDTAYAMGCDARNQDAVDKIFSIKGRAKSKSLPVIVADIEMAENFFDMNKKEKELGNKYWPEYSVKCLDDMVGKLSLILKVKNTDFAKDVMAEDDTIAVRVPNCLWAQELSQKLAGPIISTSANFSGQGACYSVKEIEESFEDFNECEELVSIILDVGELKKVLPSTIVKVEKDEIKVLRAGVAFTKASATERY